MIVVKGASAVPKNMAYPAAMLWHYCIENTKKSVNSIYGNGKDGVFTRGEL